MQDCALKQGHYQQSVYWDLLKARNVKALKINELKLLYKKKQTSYYIKSRALIMELKNAF